MARFHLRVVTSIARDICDTTARTLSRLMEADPDRARVLVETCAGACARCAEECERHAAMGMEHCRVCAEACRHCEEACRTLVGTLVA